MKHSKKFLKEAFGDAKEGLNYLARIKENKKAPILIADGPGSHKFADWTGKLQGNAAYCSLSELIDGETDSSATLLIIKDDRGDLTDPGIKAALSSRNNGQNVLIAMKFRPRSIAFVSDPTLLSIPVEDLPDDVEEEIDEVLSKLG